jgi:hypothetical protein
MHPTLAFLALLSHAHYFAKRVGHRSRGSHSTLQAGRSLDSSCLCISSSTSSMIQSYTSAQVSHSISRSSSHSKGVLCRMPRSTFDWHTRALNSLMRGATSQCINLKPLRRLAWWVTTHTAACIRSLVSNTHTAVDLWAICRSSSSKLLIHLISRYESSCILMSSRVQQLFHQTRKHCTARRPALTASTSQLNYTAIRASMHASCDGMQLTPCLLLNNHTPV